MITDKTSVSIIFYSTGSKEGEFQCSRKPE